MNVWVRTQERARSRLWQASSSRESWLQRLVLVAARLPASARHLELAPGRPNARPRVGVRHTRRLAHVLLRRARLLRAAEKHRALTKRRLERELVEGEALAAGLHDASTGSLGELERAHAHLRHLHLAEVIRDAADDNRDLALLVVLDQLAQ